MEQLFLSFLVLTLVHQGVCQLQCHQCTTLVTDDCLDFYNSDVRSDDYLGDCGDSDTHCTKFKTVIAIADSGYITGKKRKSVVVTRACESNPGAQTGCQRFPVNGGYYVKCMCDANGCNSAAGLKISLASVLLTGLTLFWQGMH